MPTIDNTPLHELDTKYAVLNKEGNQMGTTGSLKLAKEQASYCRKNYPHQAPYIICKLVPMEDI